MIYITLFIRGTDEWCQEGGCLGCWLKSMWLKLAFRDPSQSLTSLLTQLVVVIIIIIIIF